MAANGTPSKRATSARGGESRKGAKALRIIRVRVPRTQNVSPSYLALIAAHPLRPIRSEEDLDRCIAVIDKLLARRKPLDAQEQDYFESLSHEIHRYEAIAHHMPPVSDAAMLRHLMEAKEVTQSDVAAAAGIAVSTISSILAGKRSLTRAHIKALAPYFGVQQGVFLG